MNAIVKALKKAYASLHLSRKVVTQGATAALLYVATLLAHRLHVGLPVGYVTYAVPVVAGLVTGYLVPESANSAHPLVPGPSKS